MELSVSLLVGTTKGVFLLESDGERRDWDVRGPYCDGWPINHVIGDPATGTLWAAGGGEWPGAGVWRSEDGGATWTLSKLANGKFDAWLAALYAGAKPAQLFASTDRGGSWERVQGLSDHPSAEGWEPGGAGLTLHSIVASPDTPEKMWVGISAAGVFATENGGRTWDRRNRRKWPGDERQRQRHRHRHWHRHRHRHRRPNRANRGS